MNLNPFWSMSTNTSRKPRSDNEEQSGHGEQRASPARMPFGRKQLPPIPKNAAPITKPSPMGTPIHLLLISWHAPIFSQYHLNCFYLQKLPGIYVQPSYKSALMWFGVIFIRHGLYQDGVFKFTVYIPDNYPDGECPKLVFDIPVFHPLVDPVSGELDVRRAFTKWRRNHNHIWQVLMYARTVFYKINTTDPLNPEAAVLYEKDVQLFKSKVVDSVKLCNSHLFDQPKIDDPYAIRLRRPEDHHKASQASGLSWVKPGSTQPFSKEDNPPQS
uniref:Akt interacting protein n=1 Tax=Maylandia zebra TaxID=106582 RepID=A0A3P9BG44_9CICH